MNTKSSHILSTSSNLLGFTFLVLTSVKGLGLPQGGFIDEAIALCVTIFACSSFLSFLSIRTESDAKSQQYELIADYLFLFGLAIVASLSLLLAFDIIVLGK